MLPSAELLWHRHTCRAQHLSWHLVHERIHLAACVPLCSSKLKSYMHWHQQAVMTGPQSAGTCLKLRSAPQRAEVDSCLLVLGKAQKALGLAFR